MGRSRIIRPEFFTNETLSKCPPYARLLWISLWQQADKEGKLKDIPLKIHGEAFGFEPDVQIDAHLDALKLGGFIVRYEVNGEKFIQVKNWDKHQPVHNNERCMGFPNPPKDIDLQDSGKIPEHIGENTGNVAEASYSTSSFSSTSSSNNESAASGVIKNDKAEKAETLQMIAEAIQKKLCQDKPYPIANKLLRSYKPEYILYAIARIANRMRSDNLDCLKNPLGMFYNIVKQRPVTASAAEGGDDLAWKEHWKPKDWSNYIFNRTTPEPPRGPGGFSEVGGLI